MTEDAIPRTFGSWKLVGSSDPLTRKRAIVRCDCGAVGEGALEALMNSHVRCVSCKPPSAPINPAKGARRVVSDDVLERPSYRSDRPDRPVPRQRSRQLKR